MTGTGRKLDRLGVVVIGRNEGERLRRSLLALAGAGSPVVYVDSDSRDGSAELARSLGAVVVALEASQHLTAARARNSGIGQLLEECPEVEYVQFVDGDTELDPRWLQTAIDHLDGEPEIGALCGVLREKDADASVYRMLLDMEWGRETGDIRSCGGNMMVRTRAWRDVAGFREGMIGGEEAELCLRLRRARWRIRRIDAAMGIHDSGIGGFRAWFRRSVRAGYAYAESAGLHRADEERHGVRRLLGTLLWAGFLPLLILAASVLAVWWPPALPIAAGAALTYVLQFGRIFLGRRRQGEGLRPSGLYAAFLVLAKWPELVGVFLYARSRLLHRRQPWIECKS